MMKPRKTARRLIGAGAAVTAVIVLTGTNAFAGIETSTKGARLDCNTYKDTTSSGHADCFITDTLADSHPVYALMQVDGFPVQRYSWNGGANTTGYFTDRFSSDVSNWDYHYRVCRNVQWGSDNCSKWVHVHA